MAKITILDMPLHCLFISNFFPRFLSICVRSVDLLSCFLHVQSASEAIEKLHHRKAFGRQIIVNYAHERNTV